ncbi:hypothetical protein NDU88_001400 [Pleurodeles waltl]|uniref:Uncharacterized protein n=1 Tax=Pleurodeles waltl TaxID=8319 RepID=A0AAV7UT87_PLEWA|nr:hypothetical protein NDU88_001400 [Pleurodeles waltl]
MAPQFLKPASRVPGRPVRSAVRSAFGRVSSAPPATSRRGSGRRPRPARAQSGPQLLPLCATPGADSRVPAPPCTRTELGAPVSPGQAAVPAAATRPRGHLPGCFEVAGNGALRSSDRPRRHLVQHKS